MKIARITLFPLATFLLAGLTAPQVSAEPPQYVRWDIASVPCTGPGGSYPCILEPHGAATAMATDCVLNAGCSFITLTGSGTFLAAGNGQSPVVTGGGTWVVSASCTGIPFPPPGPPAPRCAGGTITKGTFVVTELLNWQKAGPLEVPACESTECETTDKIGDS